MKNALLTAIALVLAFGAQAQNKVDDIITKHLEAVGADNWSKVEAVKMEAKVTSQSAPGMEIPLTMTIINKTAARIDVTVMGMTQSSCVNGEKGWANNPFMGQTDAEPLTADQVKSMKDMTDLSGPLFGYKEKGYTAEYLGTEDVDGVEAHKIKVVMSPTKTQYSLIDPENFYEIKNVTVEKVDGQEVESASLFSDFKKVDGLIFPFSIEQNNPMMGATVTKMDKISVNPVIDQSIFKMPAK
jgi:hypothetical protein